MAERTAQAALELIENATSGGESVAVAESLTGGWVASAIVSVPGASEVFRGGVVTYQTPIKAELLGVPTALLADVGPVDPRVVAEMAERVRVLFALDGVPAGIGLATTGVAGPTPQHGHPVGDVYIAVASDAGTQIEHLKLTGSRDEIREQTVVAVLELAASTVTSRTGHDRAAE